MSESTILPRFIRASKAPAYLGMNRNLFRTLVAPSLTAIPIAIRGKAYDRLDLDRWADEYKAAMGVPPHKGGTLWQEKQCQGLSSEKASGTLRKGVNTRLTGDFEKVRKKVVSKKQKHT